MDTILGIDLGTTNSVAAAFHNGQLELIKEDGQALLPSVVGLDDLGELLVGTPARNQYALSPERTIKSIKRKMGQEIKVSLGDVEYTPQEVSAIILRTLKDRAERQLGCPITKAVITVPAFFNETQRDATKMAGELAGLEVVRIINEPTAASLTYEPDASQAEHLLVYDLGGGTFDVSIVQVEDGIIEVLSSHGDTDLGGDDFDQLLFDDVCDKFTEQHGTDPRESVVATSRLLYAVEEAKKVLSDEPTVQIQEEFLLDKDGESLHLDIEIARIDYEEMIEALLSKTLACVDDALTDSKLQANQINSIVLVGGSSRTPRVHELLRERLGQPLHMEINPDLCVAMGAAIQGARIAGAETGPILVDITPHTLGIQALGDLNGMMSENVFCPIIERNTPLPVSRSDMFATASDRQKVARISVYQGEKEDVRYNQHVGEFELDGLSDAERGNRIQVRFSLDLNGILTVTATERATNLEKRIVIDNPMERFRQSNREEAQERLAGILPSSSEATFGTEIPDASNEDLPEELRKLIEQSKEIIVRAENALPDASDEDAAELRQSIQQLTAAVVDRDEREMKAHLAALDDLVFYLQDA